MAIVTATAGATCATECMTSWGGRVPIFVEDGRDGMLAAYQRGFCVTEDYNILAFLHDDLILRVGSWVLRVTAEFDDPKVGLVGFGGGTAHGTPNIYHASYDYRQLARDGYASNVDDAEVHGKRFTGSRDVAVLDGYSLIVRREVLEKAGGWPVDKLDYIGYDYYICCMARRLGYRIRQVGVRCHHLGGMTYVAQKVGERPDAHERYQAAHRYIYDEFRDVLPYRVKERRLTTTP